MILWADTFTNHFEPDIAAAAVEMLESAGFRIQVPRQHLCCGRPLYDYGMLPTARRYLEKTLHALAAPIEQGVPVVGLEPSCVAVFKDELGNLMPHELRIHPNLTLRQAGLVGTAGLNSPEGPF